MRDHQSPSEQDLDRLLAGKAPSGGDPIDQELAAFVGEVRAAFMAPPAEDVQRLHVAAALNASRLTAHKGNPAAKPASKAQGPDRQVPGLRTWRRRTVFSTLFASLSAKVAGVALAATVATGGLAAAGVLPAPAQRAVSQAASTIGLHLPSPKDASEASERPSHTASPTPTSTLSDDNAAATSTVTVTPTVTATVTATASASPNHGACVSFAASAAESLGMTGSLKGQFISAIAQDPTAVSARVSSDGKPDAACQAAIDKAKAAATSPGKSGSNHGRPDVTATATAGDATNHSESGQENHPTATDHPGATSNPGTAHNPNDIGSTSHPSKP